MVLLLWIFYVFVLSCVCYVFVRVCLYVLCGHLLGKGWPLGSRLWCLLWVCYFPIGILSQVWYLIVSIPDLCTLTYSHSETIHVFKFLCPKYIVLFISKMCQPEWLQNTKGIIVIPQNQLDKLCFKFPEEIIIKLQFITLKFTKKFKERYVLVFVKIPYYLKTCHICRVDLHEISKPITLPFLTFNRCRFVVSQN